MKVVGFSPEQLDRIFADLAPEHIPIGEDEVPVTEPQIVSRPGDLWTLGRHRLLCGDSLLPENLKQLLGSDLADMAWIDPPYNVAYLKKRTRKPVHPIANDDLGADFKEFLQKARRMPDASGPGFF
jgi:hypothetical protein